MVEKISEYVIVVEVPKLVMPNLSSVKIKGPKDVFYMYPGSFTATLREINDIKSNLINDPAYLGIYLKEQHIALIQTQLENL